MLRVYGAFIAPNRTYPLDQVHGWVNGDHGAVGDGAEIVSAGLSLTLAKRCARFILRAMLS